MCVFVCVGVTVPLRGSSTFCTLLFQFIRAPVANKCVSSSILTDREGRLEEDNYLWYVLSKPAKHDPINLICFYLGGNARASVLKDANKRDKEHNAFPSRGVTRRIRLGSVFTNIAHICALACVHLQHVPVHYLP